MAEAVEWHDNTNRSNNAEIGNKTRLDGAISNEEAFVIKDESRNEDSNPHHADFMDIKNAPGRAESTMVWTPKALRELRLCRNRAYHKVNSKRRQNLPASLSAFTLKEWRSLHPKDQFSAKYLISTYSQHFDTNISVNTDQKTRPQQKKVKRPRNHSSLENDEGVNTKSAVASSRLWTSEMLGALVECSDIAEERTKGDVSSSEFSNLLLEEWSKRFPDSPLTARNLKSRITVYKRTRICASEPPAKKVQISNETNKGKKSKKLVNDEMITRPDAETGSEAKQLVRHSVDSQALSEVRDEFAPETSTNSFNQENNISSQAVAPYKVKACDHHWIHLFPGHPKEDQCSLTEELLNIRQRLKESFEAGDVFSLKKPKGFSLMMLKEWKKIYPNTDENIKSISVKFQRFDRGRNFNQGNATKIERDGNGRISWNPEVLNNLLKARKIAEDKVGPNASSHLLTRRWKEEWRNIYPGLECDWNAVVGRYKYHFNKKVAKCDSTTSNNKNGTRDNFDSSEADDDKVKGFRNWTGKMKEDLLETCWLIKEENPGIEAGSSEFNKLLLQKFLKLHPKCMESSRSIYSKVQSIERLESFSFSQQKTNLNSNTFKPNNVPIKPEPDIQVKMEEISELNTTNCDSKLSDEKENVAVSKNIGSIVTKPNKNNLQMQNELVPNTKQEQIMDRIGEHTKQEEKLSSISKKSIKPEKRSLPPIVGFEDWSLSSIRDFIAGMDSARKKFATLKEQNPNVNIQLIPLLLEEWTMMFPNHMETVETFHVRIKHLKQQKDLIKCHLYDTGLILRKGGAIRNSKSDGSLSMEGSLKKALPDNQSVKKNSPQFKKESTGANEEFKWTKDMIEDVIKSRMKAVKMKEEGSQLGKKLSFHNLWADEFKKVYPKSTFTSNNLSVHFWSWRKQQKKLGKSDPLYDETLSLQDTSRPTSHLPPSMTIVSNWTPRLKGDLLHIGNLVQQNLRNKGTPNEQKLKGFPNMLHAEWKQLYPNRNDTARGLNMMYTRLCKEGVNIEDSQIRRNVCVWNPKHNKMLRECIRAQGNIASHSSTDFYQKVIQEFKEKFPSIEVNKDNLLQRVFDIIQVDKSLESNLDQGKVGSGSTSTIGSQLACKDSSLDVDWSNKETIQDLLTSYKLAMTLNAQEHTTLSDLVYREFLERHPTCKAAPSTLMARLFYYKEQSRKGKLDLQGTNIKEIEKESKQCDKNYFECPKATPLQPQQVPSKIIAPKQDILFRTWTKEMIDNLGKTKKMAIIKKQKLQGQGYIDVQLSDVWYEEFIKLHPDYKSTKKNLVQKYKWYRSRMKKLGVKELPEVKKKPTPQNSTNVSDSDPPKPKDFIQKDMFSHIKALMEDTRVFLPKKLPEKPVLNQDVEDSPSIMSMPETFHPEIPANSMLLPSDSMNLNLDPNSSISPQPEVQSDPQVLDFYCENDLLEVNLTSVESDAAETLTHFHQRALNQDQLKVAPSLLSHQVYASSSCEEKSLLEVSTQKDPANWHVKKNTIKLPGGATLVAVTHGNAEALLKSKQVERPHVTITIGEKSNFTEEKAGPMSPPSSIAVPIPLPQLSKQSTNACKFNRAPVTPPPLPQLKPFGIELNKKQTSLASNVSSSTPANSCTPIQCEVSALAYSVEPKEVCVPTKVQDMLDDCGMSNHQFWELLSLYKMARDEYIDTLKKGYVAFFPFYLGTKWRMHSPDINITGRKLVSIVELYIEEKSEEKTITPEYLTKRPCQFSITEDLLLSVLSLRKEVATNMEKEEGEWVNPAFVNDKFCREWVKLNPDKRMTNKQLLSIYQVLSYDAHKEASPELDCTLAEVWELLEKSTSRTNEEIELNGNDQIELGKGKDEISDAEDLSMEKRHELLIRTQWLPRTSKKLPRRPRYAIKNRRLFWTNERLETLELCRQKAVQNLQVNLKKPFRPKLIDTIFYEFKKFYPNIAISKAQVVAKSLRQIRHQKHENRRSFEKHLYQWKLQCEELVLSEDLTKVIEEAKIAPELEKEHNSFVQDVDISRDNRDFNDDKEVLKYIAEMQSAGKSFHMLTWKADVLKDLITARAIARRRKKDRGELATQKYGGVGSAYSSPGVKHAKVDAMFKEEWSKIRPTMANLSIWTLTAYARRFDTLKKQLLAENHQESKADFSHSNKKKSFQSPIFFEHSSIPKFDLETLAKLENVPEDFRDLLVTRQRAKQLQIEGGSKFNLVEIWLSEWLKLHPSDVGTLTGNDLLNRLWIFENNSDMLACVKPALLKQTVSKKVYPTPQEYEVPRICPRENFFPEDKDITTKFNLECIINVPSKTKSKKDMKHVSLSRDYFTEKRLKLDIPAVKPIGAKNAYDDDWLMRYPAKSRSNLERKPAEKNITEFVRFEDTKKNSNLSSKTVFHNVNNLIYSLNILREKNSES